MKNYRNNLHFSYPSLYSIYQASIFFPSRYLSPLIIKFHFKFWVNKKVDKINKKFRKKEFANLNQRRKFLEIVNWFINYNINLD